MAGEIKSTTGVPVRVTKETVKKSSPSFLSSFMGQQLYSSPDGPSLPLSWGRSVCWCEPDEVLSLSCAVMVLLLLFANSASWRQVLLECSAVTCPHHTQQVSSPAVPVQPPASICPWASPCNPACRHEVSCSGQGRLSAVVPQRCGSRVRAGELKDSWCPWTLVKQLSPEFCPSEAAVSARSWGCLVMRTGTNVLEWRTSGPSIALAKGNQLLKLPVEKLDVSLKRIFLTSAASSDMVVQEAGGKQKKKKGTHHYLLLTR